MSPQQAKEEREGQKQVISSKTQEKDYLFWMYSFQQKSPKLMGQAESMEMKLLIRTSTQLARYPKKQKQKWPTG